MNLRTVLGVELIGLVTNVCEVDDEVKSSTDANF